MSSIKYVKVDAFHRNEEREAVIGGYGIDGVMIHNEVLRQFNEGIIDDDWNPTAYIEIDGIKMQVTLVVDRICPWKNYYRTTSDATSREVRGQNLNSIDYYSVLDIMELI